MAVEQFAQSADFRIDLVQSFVSVMVNHWSMEFRLRRHRCELKLLVYLFRPDQYNSLFKRARRDLSRLRRNQHHLPGVTIVYLLRESTAAPGESGRGARSSPAWFDASGGGSRGLSDPARTPVGATLYPRPKPPARGASARAAVHDASRACLGAGGLRDDGHRPGLRVVPWRVLVPAAQAAVLPLAGASWPPSASLALSAAAETLVRPVRRASPRSRGRSCSAAADRLDRRLGRGGPGNRRCQSGERPRPRPNRSRLGLPRPPHLSDRIPRLDVLPQAVDVHGVLSPGLSGSCGPSLIDLVHAHDLNTLPVAAIVAMRRGCRLVYDAHELYPEISTLSKREKRIWAVIEHRSIRRADAVVTVCQSIADELTRRHRLVSAPTVLLNCPPAASVPSLAAPVNLLRIRAGLENSLDPIILYQGGFSPNRGLEELLYATPYLDCGVVVLMGWGNLELLGRARRRARRRAARSVRWPGGASRASPLHRRRGRGSHSVQADRPE